MGGGCFDELAASTRAPESEHLQPEPADRAAAAAASQLGGAPRSSTTRDPRKGGEVMAKLIADTVVNWLDNKMTAWEIRLLSKRG